MGERISKRTTAEMKRSRSGRKHRAAVSIQTARMIDKLLERSQGLSGSSYEHINNATTTSKIFEGATNDKNSAVLTDGVNNYNLGESKDTIAISTGERQEKTLLGRNKTIKTASISRTSKDMLYPGVDYSHLSVDKEGKHKPTVSNRFDVGERYTHSLTPDQVVRRAAPALYDIKKAIDDAEEQKSQRAA